MSHLNEYASAIATRIADEWHGATDFPDDAVLLQKVLAKVLSEHPEECSKLIGTGIIEEDFFGDI